MRREHAFQLIICICFRSNQAAPNVRQRVTSAPAELGAEIHKRLAKSSPYAGLSAGAEVARLRMWHVWCLLEQRQPLLRQPTFQTITNISITFQLHGPNSCQALPVSSESLTCRLLKVTVRPPYSTKRRSAPEEKCP